MKVLLANPEKYALDGSKYPPLGLLYLASTVRKHGYQVEVVDGVVEGDDTILDRIGTFRPDIIGISCLTSCRHYSLELARKAKQLVPHAIVVLGGAHPTLMGRQIVEHYSFVDLVVVGEGEMTFLEIVQGKPFQDIAGIIYRSGDKVVKTKTRALIENLDELPFPAWDMVKFDRYPAIGQGVINGVDVSATPHIPITFCRGCLGKCNFCSNWAIWRKCRYRSAENIVAEMELLTTNYNIRHYWMVDDAMAADREGVLSFCHLIRKKQLKIAFMASARADSVDMEVLTCLHEAGCYELHYGVESGSQQMLDSIGKDMDVETNRQAILMTRQAGIRVVALMMVGNIGETIKTINASVGFLKETKPDQTVTAGGLILFPGTKVYTYGKSKGYIDDDFWLGDELHKYFCLEYSSIQLQIFVSALIQLKKLSNNWWLNYYFLYGQFSWKGFVWFIAPKRLKNIYLKYVSPVLNRQSSVQTNLIE